MSIFFKNFNYLGFITVDMILHRKLGENAIFMQAMKKIEGLFFEGCYTCMLWSKIFLVRYVQVWLRNKTIKWYGLALKLKSPKVFVFRKQLKSLCS